MATVDILYWHDIPLQVRVRAGRDRASQPLPQRFQEAADNAAMLAGVIGDDAYTEGLRWEASANGKAHPTEIAQQVAAEIAAAQPVIDWRRTAEQIKST